MKFSESAGNTPAFSMKTPAFFSPAPAHCSACFESLSGFVDFASAATPAAPPKRLVFLALAGDHDGDLVSRHQTDGKDYTLPEGGLEAVSEAQGGLFHRAGRLEQIPLNLEGHWGSRCGSRGEPIQ